MNLPAGYTFDPELERARWYLAGIIDGEGCITRVMRWPGSTVPNVRITVANTDWGIIEETKRCFDVLGIGYYVSRSHRPTATTKQCWSVCVQKAKCIVLASEIIPLQHAPKREKLLSCAQELREKSRLGVVQGHGSQASYQRGCRCDDCRQAERAYRLKRRMVEA